MNCYHLNCQCIYSSKGLISVTIIFDLLYHNSITCLHNIFQNNEFFSTVNYKTASVPPLSLMMSEAVLIVIFVLFARGKYILAGGECVLG